MTRQPPRIVKLCANETQTANLTTLLRNFQAQNKKILQGLSRGGRVESEPGPWPATPGLLFLPGVVLLAGYVFNGAIPGAGFEFTPGFAMRPEISHVLFDFDGTLSLIRQGWPEVMVADVRRDVARVARRNREARRQLCDDDIMRLNGKQTIYQMIQLAERIRERGGAPATRSGTSKNTCAGSTNASTSPRRPAPRRRQPR